MTVKKLEPCFGGAAFPGFFLPGTPSPLVLILFPKVPTGLESHYLHHELLFPTPSLILNEPLLSSLCKEIDLPNYKFSKYCFVKHNTRYISLFLKYFYPEIHFIHKYSLDTIYAM